MSYEYIHDSLIIDPTYSSFAEYKKDFDYDLVGNNLSPYSVFVTNYQHFIHNWINDNYFLTLGIVFGSYLMFMLLLTVVNNQANLIRKIKEARFTISLKKTLFKHKIDSIRENIAQNYGAKPANNKLGDIHDQYAYQIYKRFLRVIGLPKADVPIEQDAEGLRFTLESIFKTDLYLKRFFENIEYNVNMEAKKFENFYVSKNKNQWQSTRGTKDNDKKDDKKKRFDFQELADNLKDDFLEFLEKKNIKLSQPKRFKAFTDRFRFHRNKYHITVSKRKYEAKAFSPRSFASPPSYHERERDEDTLKYIKGFGEKDEEPYVEPEPQYPDEFDDSMKDSSDKSDVPIEAYQRQTLKDYYEGKQNKYLDVDESIYLQGMDFDDKEENKGIQNIADEIKASIDLFRREGQAELIWNIMDTMNDKEPYVYHQKYTKDSFKTVSTDRVTNLVPHGYERSVYNKASQAPLPPKKKKQKSFRITEKRNSLIPRSFMEDRTKLSSVTEKSIIYGKNLKQSKQPKGSEKPTTKPVEMKTPNDSPSRLKKDASPSKSKSELVSKSSKRSSPDTKREVKRTKKVVWENIDTSNVDDSNLRAANIVSRKYKGRRPVLKWDHSQSRS